MNASRNCRASIVCSYDPKEDRVVEGETELEMVRRHVREGKGHVARQDEIVIKLQKLGTPTERLKKNRHLARG